MLTGSVSWALESPCSFDDFEVATWVGERCLTAIRRQTSICRIGHKGKVVAVAENVDVVYDSSHVCSLGFLLLFIVWSLPLYI